MMPLVRDIMLASGMLSNLLGLSFPYMKAAGMQSGMVMQSGAVVANIRKAWEIDAHSQRSELGCAHKAPQQWAVSCRSCHGPCTKRDMEPK